MNDPEHTSTYLTKESNLEIPHPVTKRRSKVVHKEEVEPIKQIELERKLVTEQNNKSLRKVKLDVGGKIFSTSMTTLTNAPNSMLSAMFSGRYNLETDPDGTIFIDRNPTYFEHILDWLRTGKVPFLDKFSDKVNLLEEAKYFVLDKLVAQLEEDIVDNKMHKSRISQKEFIKIVSKSDDRRPLYLVGCDLRELHLASQNLALANLDGANLKGMNLQYVNLSYASLQNANLENANLKGANLERAMLSNANLEDANMTSCNLLEADLSDAVLSGVSLSSANLTGSNFSNADLSDANLSSVSLNGAKFNNANLENADFSNTGGHATFTGAKGKYKK